MLASEDADDAEHDDALWLLAGVNPIATLDLAFYEVANVAARAWHDLAAAERLRQRVAAIADDGGLVHVDPTLLSTAVKIADEHGISVYEAAYVAAASSLGCELVSCDARDLVSRGLALFPSRVRSLDRAP